MTSPIPIEIHQDDDGQVHIELRLDQGTLWLSQAQMAELFETDADTIDLHLKEIYQQGELQETSTTRERSVASQDGKRQVQGTTRLYNLDAAISVAYRIHSRKGTQFRLWATQRLSESLVNGYTIDQQRFAEHAAELEQAKVLLRKAVRSPASLTDEGRGVADIISRYSQTFLWLQRYDEGWLEEPEGHPGGSLTDPAVAMQALGELKQQLMARGEATDLFANPRSDGLQGIFGNLEQSVFGEPAYPSIESKAAHLLYFVVKNHPFSDGNKRSGAFLFVDFLHRNGCLVNAQGEAVINDTGLAALTLLVAESDPKQKETLIRLIMSMLSAE